MKKLIAEQLFEGVTIAFVIDREGGSARTLKTLGTPVVSQSIDRRQMQGWIQKEARLADKMMTQEAMREVIEGSRYFEYQSRIDLFFIKSELDKLFSTPEQKIGVERVRSMLAIPAEERVFDMIRSITMAKSERALEMYSHLKASGEVYNIISRLFETMSSSLANICRVFSKPKRTGKCSRGSSGFVLRKIQNQAGEHSREFLWNNWNCV